MYPPIKQRDLGLKYVQIRWTMVAMSLKYTQKIKLLSDDVLLVVFLK